MKVTEIQTMRAAGKLMREIAKHYGCRADTLREFMEKNGIAPVKKFKWDSTADSDLKMHRDNGLMNKDIAALFGCSTKAVQHRVTTLGIGDKTVKNNITITAAQLRDMEARVRRGDRQADIAADYDMSIPALTRKLKKGGIATKNYIVNHTYFKNIDTEDTAYFLGLMYADGYNSAVKNQIKLKLLTEDKYIIEKLASLTTQGSALPPIPEEKGSNCSVLQIYSKEMCADLTNHGCGQAKAFDVKFPTFLSPELLRHFIRGYFDGDGSAFLQIRGMSRTSFTSVNFTGNEDFITSLRDYLVKTLVVSKVIISKLGSKGTVQIKFSSYKDILAIRNYFYEKSDPALRLTRKFDKFPTKKVLEAGIKKGIGANTKYDLILIKNIEDNTITTYTSLKEASTALNVDWNTLNKAGVKGHIAAKKYKVMLGSKDSI